MQLQKKKKGNSTATLKDEGSEESHEEDEAHTNNYIAFNSTIKKLELKKKKNSLCHGLCCNVSRLCHRLCCNFRYDQCQGIKVSLIMTIVKKLG